MRANATRRRSATARSVASSRTRSRSRRSSTRTSAGRPRPGHDRHGLELAERLGVQPAGLELLATRGFLELSLADAAAAELTLDRVAELAESSGLRDPRALPFPRRPHRGQDHTRPARSGVAAAGRTGGDGARLQRIWPLTIAARCRGLLCSSLGEPGRRVGAALEEALALHDRMGEPFERARTLLALGSVQRRDRKKRPARESLESALWRSTSWRGARAERARGELGARGPGGPSTA